MGKDVVSHGSGKRGPRAITSGRLVLARLGLVPPNPRSLQSRLLTRDRLPLVRVTSVRDRMPSSGGGDGIPRRVCRREVAYGRVVDAEREDAAPDHERGLSVSGFRFHHQPPWNTGAGDSRISIRLALGLGWRQRFLFTPLLGLLDRRRGVRSYSQPHN